MKKVYLFLVTLYIVLVASGIYIQYMEIPKKQNQIEIERKKAELKPLPLKNSNGVKLLTQSGIDTIFIPQLREKITNKVREGKIAFNAPKDMYVDGTEEIEVKITDDFNKILNFELKKKEAIRRENINIYHTMKADLKGVGFEVKPLQEDTYFLIPHNKVTTWHWAVTPEKSGKQKLYLKVNAKINLNGSSVDYTLQNFESTIEVKVNPAKWFQRSWFKIFEIFILITGGGIFTYFATQLKVIKESNLISEFIKKISSSLKRLLSWFRRIINNKK